MITEPSSKNFLDTKANWLFLPINLKGEMDKMFAYLYTDMYYAVSEFYQTGKLKEGTVLTIRNSKNNITKASKNFLCVPVSDESNKLNKDLITAGCDRILEIYKDRNIDSVAVPKMNSQETAPWSEIRAILLEKFSDPSEISIEMYE